jgi:hypothetical protein
MVERRAGLIVGAASEASTRCRHYRANAVPPVGSGVVALIGFAALSWLWW